MNRGPAADSVPEPGLITKVISDTLIHVGGFTADGTPFACTPVELLQDDAKPSSAVFAYWMPYQLEQAAKAVPTPHVIKPGAPS